MAQLQEFAIVQTGKRNVPNCPTCTINGKVYDDNNLLVADFTGANNLKFPDVLATLTEDQVVLLTQKVATWLILTKAGLPAA